MQKCRHPILTLSCAIFLLAILLFCVKPVWEKVEPTDTTPKGTKGLAYHALSDGTYSVSVGSATNAKKIVIPEVYNGKAVTAIADRGFGGASKLEKITIPDSVIEIGDFAFNNCSELVTVKLPPHLVCIGAHAFAGCKALSELTVPDSVLNLGEAAFFGCTKLERVTLGDGIAQIGTDVFFGCTKLASVALPENLTEIGEQAFFGCKALAELTLPDSVTEIGDAAFSGCAKLERLAPGNGVTVIGAYAFSGCSRLTVSTLPNSIVEIRDFAFSGCAGFELTEYEGISYLGSYDNPYHVAVGFSSSATETSVPVFHPDTKIILYRAFQKNASITSLFFPNGLLSIGDSAFEECRTFENCLVIPDTTKVIGDYAFRLISSRALHLGNSVERIGVEAFSGAMGLTAIEIPDSVTELGECAFYSCKSAQTLTIGNGLRELGQGVFKSCSKIREVRIPDTVQTIASEAFSNCKSLHWVVVPTSVEQIDQGAFIGMKFRSVLIFYEGDRAQWWASHGMIDETDVFYYSQAEPTENQSLYWIYVNGEPTRWRDLVPSNPPVWEDGSKG